MTKKTAVLDPGEITLLNSVDRIDDILPRKFTDNFLFIIPNV